MRRCVAGAITIAGLMGSGCDDASSSTATVEESWSTPEQRRSALIEEFDTSSPLIDLDELLAGGPPRDGIPALVSPARLPAQGAPFPPPDGRVVEVRRAGEAVAYPLAILNYHEIANDVVGGVPVAVTYCPLCDSVSVIDRRVGAGAENERVIEFGVSGLLYNSNVMMYDRLTMGLWSQVSMQGVSGPDSGRALEHLPFRVVSFAMFQAQNKGGQVLSTETGHVRPYEHNPYESYFGSNRHFHSFDADDRLPAHTLGLGVRVGERSWFVVAEAARAAPIVLETPAGPIEVLASESGVEFDALPEGASALQTYYHSWSAFHADTEIVGAPGE